MGMFDDDLIKPEVNKIEFKKINNPKEYVEKLLEISPAILAEKRGYVMAKIGKPGTQVVTYVPNGTKEKVNIVGYDENGDIDIILSSADPIKGKTIDKYGHDNSYIVKRSYFDKHYQNSNEISDNEHFFKPIPDIRRFIQIKEDISIKTTYGKDQNLRAGSYLNITNPDDIYGISLENFKNDYEFF